MNCASVHSASLLSMPTIALAIALGVGAAQAAGPAPLDLGLADHFAILTKTGVTNVPTSAVTGDIGVSPIAATAITGFSLIADSTNRFSTSSQVTGRIYAANYAVPTPANLTTTISNMEAAYTDAAGRSLPDFTELYAGNISGRTLAPGLYKWSTGVLISTDVTLAGASDAVWIFQIAGNLTAASGAKVVLSGGAQAKNVFWQVAGGVGVEIGTTAHVEGTILSKKAIHLRTGASLNGRALAQTAVTLEKNRIVNPGYYHRTVIRSGAARDGWVLESGENTSVGGTIDATENTFRLGDSQNNRQYRSILHFDTAGLPDGAVIDKVVLKLLKRGIVGVNPFTTHGRLKADIRKPHFGLKGNLESRDFQAGANDRGAGTFSAVLPGDWYRASLTPTGRSFVNLSGTTQFRLRFEMDDNNNNVADYMAFYSGDAAVAKRPQLIVTYHMP